VSQACKIHGISRLRSYGIRKADKEDSTRLTIFTLTDNIVLTSVITEMKALIDRAGFVGLANGRMFKNKIGASLCCFRRAGGIHTIDAMNHFYQGNDFIIAGWVHCVVRDKGDVEKDAEGIQSARTLGQRIAWLAKKLYG